MKLYKKIIDQRITIDRTADEIARQSNSVFTTLEFSGEYDPLYRFVRRARYFMGKRMLLIESYYKK